MAEEFPHVKFHGCNFVPIRHPHYENVLFEVYNLNDGFLGKNGTFDLIHCRGTFKMASRRDGFSTERGLDAATAD